MTKTYMTCPGPGWYWCRIHDSDDGKQFLREHRSDGLAYDSDGDECCPTSEYTDFEPVSIVPREVEEKMTRGEEIAGALRNLILPTTRQGLAAAIDKALAEEREKARGVDADVDYWMRTAESRAADLRAIREVLDT